MELAAIVAQQSVMQSKVAMTMVKQANDAQQAIVSIIAQTVDGSRGQNLNITV